jgi:hypothetical protein
VGGFQLSDGQGIRKANSLQTSKSSVGRSVRGSLLPPSISRARPSNSATQRRSSKSDR